MKRALWTAVWLGAVALIGAGFSVASGIEFWWAFVMVAAAIFVNGWVATLEDDLPGGFNNPDGTHTPGYAVVTGWVVRGLGAVLILLFAVVLFISIFGAN